MKYFIGLLGTAWFVIFLSIALIRFSDGDSGAGIGFLFLSALGILAMIPYLMPEKESNAYYISSKGHYISPRNTLNKINECMHLVKTSRSSKVVEGRREMGLKCAYDLKDLENTGAYNTYPSASSYIAFFEKEAFLYVNELNSPKHFDLMEGREFEHYCAKLLKNNGFTNVEVTSTSGDFGVDVLAEKKGTTYAFQCKRQSSNVSNRAVQEIFSGKEFYKRDKGIVLTNQYFTKSAKETAERTDIELWDRKMLESMIKDTE